MSDSKGKVIVCDLDGTLTKSKSDLEKEMSHKICQVLKNNRFAVISGAGFPQFQSQFLSQLDFSNELKKNLFIFPTNGSSCYTYDYLTSDWSKLYEENLTEEEKERVFKALNKAIESLNMDLKGSYGEIIEDRGGQVTFSGRGQEAPLSVKELWDKDKTKRQEMVKILKEEIPEFEIRIGGSTSIDITPKGIDKAYAIGKILEVLSCSKEDIIFIGDALFPGGNDESVKSTGVLTISVSGPEETIKIFDNYI
ncbi:MAG: HAD-IIB family hydrolase [Candidatus Paceibacterota bacterium]